MKNYLQLTRHTGNNSLFLAVEMSLISTLRGSPFHIHAEGLRGTGKTTIMRSVKQILPKITRIKGCLYNCDPTAPHCPQHKNMTAEEIASIGTEEITVPFLEISHSAKIGTVAGTIDLSKLTNPNQPEAALLPGIIPQAHRGIIFIDEINRLADTSPEITMFCWMPWEPSPAGSKSRKQAFPLWRFRFQYQFGLLQIPMRNQGRWQRSADNSLTVLIW